MSCKRCGGNHYVVESGAKRNCPNCVVEDADDSVLAEAEELGKVCPSYSYAHARRFMAGQMRLLGVGGEGTRR